MNEFLGRELIIYILENKLEDVSIFDEAFFSGFMSVEEAAKKLECGTATIMALINLNRIRAIETCGCVYIFPNSLEEYMKAQKAVINGGMYV